MSGESTVSQSRANKARMSTWDLSRTRKNSPRNAKLQPKKSQEQEGVKNLSNEMSLPSR